MQNFINACAFHFARDIVQSLICVQLVFAHSSAGLVSTPRVTHIPTGGTQLAPWILTIPIGMLHPSCWCGLRLVSSSRRAMSLSGTAPA